MWFVSILKSAAHYACFPAGLLAELESCWTVLAAILTALQSILLVEHQGNVPIVFDCSYILIGFKSSMETRPVLLLQRYATQFVVAC